MRNHDLNFISNEYISKYIKFNTLAPYYQSTVIAGKVIAHSFDNQLRCSMTIHGIAHFVLNLSRYELFIRYSISSRV